MIDYKTILDEAAISVLGEKLDIEVDRSRVHINGVYPGGSRYSIHTIFLSDDGKHFVLDECHFNSPDFFRAYAEEIMRVHVKPTILKSYMDGHIDKLPPKVKHIETIDLDAITPEWFKNEFDRLAEEHWNCDTARNVEVKRDDKHTVITFDMNCGRGGVWEGNTIKINDRGTAKINVDDTPIEGGDLESWLKRSIEAKVRGRELVNEE